MKTRTLIIALSISFLSIAQKGKTEQIQSLENQPGKIVKLEYSWKKLKDGKQALKVNFKNKSGVAIETFAEFGFYVNGVQQEKSVITDCLKKSWFNNWFRSYQLIQIESLTQEEFNAGNLEVQVLDFKADKTDECREADSE